jgi:PhnB protein
MKLYTHLNFGGNCREAFQFYEQHLGGKITMMMTQGEMPSGNRAPGTDANAIAHARMNIGNAELIGNDVPAGHFQPMRSVYLYLAVDSVEEAERIYAVLSEQGEVYMPLEETFYAPRFGMLRDRFGVSWTLIFERTR